MTCNRRQIQRRAPVIAALLLIMPLSVVRAGEPTIYLVGTAKVDITPDYPIRLNGFGNRRKESEGVSQRIYARALAIAEPGGKPLVLIAIDNLGVRVGMVDEVARRLQASNQIPRQNVALTFTHTHCAPKVNGASDNIFSTPIPPAHQDHIDRYTGELTEHLARVAQQAVSDLRPSWMEWATGKVRFSKNRRTPGGPVDQDLPTLFIRDAETDEIRAVYVSYACHCVTLSFNQISGDWAGYAVEAIERNLPGAMALVSIGAGSDLNPIPGVQGDKVDVAAGQGAEIGAEVQRLLTQERVAVTGSPRATSARIELPLNERPTREQLEALVKKGRHIGYNATTQLARLDRGEPLLAAIDYPIQTWSFGDSLCMVFLAGEVCVDYALRLKTELDHSRFWLNAYSNDFCSYIPSERLAREGRYGGGSETPYFALPTTIAAGMEQRIIDEVHRQVPDAFNEPEGTQGVAPKTPAASLECLSTHDELRVELVAAEPLIADPVAIDFGGDGRLWVAEMSDYGRGVYESFKPHGRIRWLRDQDGDGRFEQARTFVSGLRFPTDVKVWRDGVLICDAPDILLARDQDGDGVAESVEKLLSGFEVRNAQARVNSLRWGLDNWLYGSCGLFGGKITSYLTGAEVDLTSRDFRFHPDTGAIEAVAGRTQQGRCRNDWGDWFGCSNGTLIRHYPNDARYAGRNPFAAPAPAAASVADANASTLYPPPDLVRFELSGAPGKATSACGLGIYRDSLLGAAYLGNAFTCEPVHQLVHRTVLEPAGLRFAGRRAENEQQTEFLRSTDQWFRPVQMRTGPDGAIWVVDMYRYVIEHARWIPQATLARLNVYAGQGRGRIYRILPSENRDPRQPANFDELSNRELVLQLDQSNGILRDLAHQTLLWRNAGDVAKELIQLATSGERPLSRIHAMAILDALGRLEPAVLLAAVASEHPEVARHAIRLAEPRLDDHGELLAAVIGRATDAEVRVRRQVAWSLGSCDDPRAAAALAGILAQDGGDVDARAVVISSLADHNVADVLAAFRHLPDSGHKSRELRELAALAVRLGDPAAIPAVLADFLPADSEGPSSRTTLDDSVKTVIAILDAADARSPAGLAANQKSFPASSCRRVQDIYLAARQVAARPDATEPQWRLALDLLGRRRGPVTAALLESDDPQVAEAVGEAQTRRLLASLVSARRTADLQQAAVEALTNTGGEQAAERLLGRFGSVGTATRGIMLDALLSRPAWTRRLLQEFATGTLRTAILDAGRRQRLLTHADANIRQEAAVLLRPQGTSTRSDVVKSFSAALDLSGDVARGRDVFRKTCSTCHRAEDHGHVVGPDLAALTNDDPQWLLATILDPNREVDARYIAWNVVRTDGRTLNGLLVEESDTAIRLREAGGREHVILRRELDELHSASVSVMPEGLEKEISPQAMADLLAYVTTLRVARPQLAGKAGSPALPRRPPEIAPFLLDATQPQARRVEVIDQRPGMGPAIIALLVADLQRQVPPRADQHLPWIWRVALAVGKRNDGGEIRDLLEVSLPRPEQPLEEWQAVVVGGGIINGLTQAGDWPRARLTGILSGAPEIAARWPRTLELAAAMADDEAVRDGTRYDALRMIALAGWDARGPQLVQYLAAGAANQLQMGAVSGLSDIRSPEVIQPLIDALPSLTARNRKIALEALTRTETRALALLEAVDDAHVAVDGSELSMLHEHASKAVRAAASRILPQ